MPTPKGGRAGHPAAGTPVWAARRVLVLLGTFLVLVGTVAPVVDHEVLDADRFAAHADAVRAHPLNGLD